MKKQIYFAIIGIGAILAIIGFIPGGMSGIWGILIAGITAGLYFINTRNEQKVQERLNEEKGMFEGDAGKESPGEASSEEPAEPDVGDAADEGESGETEDAKE
jgi:hypothetical protein